MRYIAARADLINVFLVCLTVSFFFAIGKFCSCDIGIMFEEWELQTSLPLYEVEGVGEMMGGELNVWWRFQSGRVADCLIIYFVWGIWFALPPSTRCRSAMCYDHDRIISGNGFNNESQQLPQYQFFFSLSLSLYIPINKLTKKLHCPGTRAPMSIWT